MKFRKVRANIMVSLGGLTKSTGGGLINQSGWYLCEVTSQETTNDYGTQVELSVRVDGIGDGIGDEQLGKNSRIWLSTAPSDFAKDPERAQAAITSKLVNLAYSMNVIDKNQLEAVKNGEDIEIDFNVSNPVQTYLKINVWEKKNGKTNLDVRESRPVSEDVAAPPIMKMAEVTEAEPVSHDDDGWG